MPTLHTQKLKAVSTILKKHLTNLSVDRTIDIAGEIIDAIVLVEETGRTPDEAKNAQS